jgi:hypothetical protein
VANRFRFDGREFELGRLMLSEAKAIQKVTGFTMGEFEKRLELGDVECIAALIWVALKREQPDLRYDDVDGDLSTFEPVEDEDASATEAAGKDEPEPSSTAGPSSEAG